MPLLIEDGEGSPGCGTSSIRRGTRKRESERERESSWMSPVRASATDTSLSVAHENHLMSGSFCWNNDCFSEGRKDYDCQLTRKRLYSFIDVRTLEQPGPHLRSTGSTDELKDSFGVLIQHH